MMRQLSTVRAVFFDLDGTLCDYGTASRTARNYVLQELARRFPGLEPADLTIQYRSATEESWSQVLSGVLSVEGYTRGKFSTLLKKCGIPDEALADDLKYIYYGKALDELRLLDDANRVLGELSQRFLLAMITDGISWYQQAKISKLGIRKFFKRIYVAEEVESRKPSKQIFLLALRECGMGAKESVYVGDSQRRDVVGAKGVGMTCIWVNRRGDQLKSGIPEPDYQVGSLQEIVDILAP